MNNIMQALHTDHVNFSRLLDILTENLQTLRDGGRPDYTAMLDVIEYFEDYADLYHHPKEDAIYSICLERNPEARAVIAELMQQHHTLKQSTGALRKTLEGLLHDAVVSKAQFMTQLADFIERQTVHLTAEEANIFSFLNLQLTAQDWARIEAMIPPRPDPLFGGAPAYRSPARAMRLAEPCD
ncbi:MAG: hemerythrin domain-containing protein [Candidatus Competibacteraceae bacterium]